MKKVLFSLSFLFFVVFLQAQDYTLRYGAKLGANYADLYASDRCEYFHTKSNLTIGGFAEVYRSDSTNLAGLFLRGGLTYSKRAVKYTDNEATDNQYFEIPIQIGYKYKAFSFLNVYLLAGPYVDFRIYGCSDINGESSWDAENVCGGLQANLGFEFLEHYQIEAGYQYGLLADYKGPKFSGMNRTFMVTLGLAF